MCIHSFLFVVTRLGRLTVPDFDDFKNSIHKIKNDVEFDIQGDVARYIPQLACVSDISMSLQTKVLPDITSKGAVL